MKLSVALPNADTPLPPTNATLHICVDELGYGTPNRAFIMACGFQWKAGEAGGEHKYFYDGEPYWFKHVNCDGCRRAFEL